MSCFASAAAALAAALRPALLESYLSNPSGVRNPFETSESDLDIRALQLTLRYTGERDGESKLLTNPKCERSIDSYNY